MTDETVTVEVELPRETREALPADGSPAEALADLADREARLRESIQRYVEGDRDGDSRISAGTLAELSPPVGVLLGFDAVEAGEGRAVVEMAAGPQHANPMGTLHGGVLCDLGDAAMGTAYATTLADGESFTTLELDAKYLKPVWSGRLTATAEVVGGGRTVGLVECDVTDEEGSLVARLQSVCLTLRGERAEGR